MTFFRVIAVIWLLAALAYLFALLYFWIRGRLRTETSSDTKL